MQDRYKFKIWDKTEKKFLPLDSKTENTDSWISIDNTGVYLVERDNARDVAFFTDITEDVIILQCTGLKDKNGKLIYEGYVVKTTFDDNSKTIFYVIWNNENALFNGKIIKKGETNAFCINEDYLYYLLANGIDEKTEIIGNIYENPELLREENNARML